MVLFVVLIVSLNGQKPGVYTSRKNLSCNCSSRAKVGIDLNIHAGNSAAFHSEFLKTNELFSCYLNGNQSSEVKIPWDLVQKSVIYEAKCIWYIIFLCLYGASYLFGPIVCEGLLSVGVPCLGACCLFTVGPYICRNHSATSSDDICIHRLMIFVFIVWWYLYLSSGDFCIHRLVIFVFIVWWSLYSSSGDPCIHRLVIFVFIGWWFLYSSSDDICIHRLMIFVFIVWWSLHSSSGDICFHRLMIFV